MPKVTAENVREALVRHADRRSRLRTDESNLYPKVGAEYAAHETVKHSAGEYVRGPKGPDRIHTDNAEGFFGVFKRGMRGVYQHCGEQHMQRYLDEFAFRFNRRRNPAAAFARLLGLAAGLRPATYQMLINRT
jgi:hypothetical protein